MNRVKEHITFKILTFVLVIVLLIPIATKFAHAFTHHNHEVCAGEKATHLHEIDVDCDFYKFQLNKNFSFTYSYTELFPLKELPIKTISSYSFLSKYQRLHFSLRGPPVSI